MKHILYFGLDTYFYYNGLYGIPSFEQEGIMQCLQCRSLDSTVKPRLH